MTQIDKYVMAKQAYFNFQQILEFCFKAHYINLSLMRLEFSNGNLDQMILHENIWYLLTL